MTINESQNRVITVDDLKRIRGQKRLRPLSAKDEKPKKKTPKKKEVKENDDF